MQVFSFNWRTNNYEQLALQGRGAYSQNDRKIDDSDRNFRSNHRW